MTTNIKPLQLSAVLLISFVSFSLAYHWEILNPFNIDWLMTRIDRAMTYLGWLFFKNGSWSLPLGSIPEYFYPAGSTVGFTDSIPLLAFFFKPFVGGFAGDFQYFGAWLLACFLLQGVFAWFLSKEILKNGWVRVLAAAFFAFSPVMLMRRAHLSLNAHWIILASLWLILSRNAPEGRKRVVFFCVLAVLGALVHPYLSLMVFAVFLADIVGEVAVRRRPVLEYSVYFTACAVLVVFLWKLMGYFDLPLATRMTSVNYGEYAMNLNSFFNPVGTSRLLPDSPLYYEGQWEGYAYLGAGMMVLCAAAVVFIFRDKGAFVGGIKKHYPVVAAAVLMALFALGPEVTAGKALLFKIGRSGVIEYLSQTMRAGGRFVWVLYYLVVFFALKASVLLAKKPARAVCLLSLALALQLWDISPLFMRLYSPLPGREWVSIDEAKWREALKGYEKLYFCPPGLLSYEKDFDFGQFVYLAGINRMVVNTGRITRGNVDRINAYIFDFCDKTAKGGFEPDALYVLGGPAKESVIEAVRKYRKVFYLDGYALASGRPGG
ncbi:MAG: hypothetical protein JW803_08465 [Endomicrobiales bacterium]|nr:hypothetical protein [Endomicrobiales bacterium]